MRIEPYLEQLPGLRVPAEQKAQKEHEDVL